jgi:hypothetical protein
MKLLFLDVDGVLNDGYRGYPFLVEHCLRLLKHIIEETKAQIVLSSNWRLFNEYRGVLMPKLIEHGIIEKDVFSSTPDLDLDHLPLRPREILQWIRDNTSICPWQKNRELPKVDQFVVIDDRNLVKELYGQSLHGQFVQTNGQIGLTMEIAKKVIKLLNQPAHLTSTSTWALTHWPVFNQFEDVSYVQSLVGIRVVDNRVCQEKLHTPLDCFPSLVLSRIVQFLTISEMSSVSCTSHKFNNITTTNDVWQPLYQSLKERNPRPKPSDSLLGNVFQQSWPLSVPVDGYYKVACYLFLASQTSSISTLNFVRKFLQCASSPDSGELTVESCPRCHEKSELIPTGLASSKYGLNEPELSTMESSPSRRSIKMKERKLVCDVEAQLLSILKWGSLGAIRKRRASWQTGVEELCTDGSRKAAKLLQSLRLQNIQVA